MVAGSAAVTNIPVCRESPLFILVTVLTFKECHEKN
jgi:hypothetical protein